MNNTTSDSASTLRYYPRFRLWQLFAGVTVVALVLSVIPFRNRERFGPLQHTIPNVVFSPDGTRIAVFAYDYRDAGVPLKGYVANVSRTIGLIDAATLSKFTAVEHDFRKGNQGPDLAHALGWDWRFEFTPDSSLLYTFIRGGRIQAWDIAAGRGPARRSATSLTATVSAYRPTALGSRFPRASTSKCCLRHRINRLRQRRPGMAQ